MAGGDGSVEGAAAGDVGSGSCGASTGSLSDDGWAAAARSRAAAGEAGALMVGGCGAVGPLRDDTTVVATAAATATRVSAIHFAVGDALAAAVGLVDVVSTGSGVPRGETPSGTKPIGATTPAGKPALCRWSDSGF